MYLYVCVCVCVFVLAATDLKPQNFRKKHTNCLQSGEEGESQEKDDDDDSDDDNVQVTIGDIKAWNVSE